MGGWVDLHHLASASKSFLQKKDLRSFFFLVPSEPNVERQIFKRGTDLPPNENGAQRSEERFPISATEERSDEIPKPNLNSFGDLSVWVLNPENLVFVKTPFFCKGDLWTSTTKTGARFISV